MKLTYNYLGEDNPEVGSLLGIDSTGWPYKVEKVESNEEKTKTFVTIEPWDIPGSDASPVERIEFDQAILAARYLSRIGAIVDGEQR